MKKNEVEEENSAFFAQNKVGDYEIFDLIGKGTFASVWEGCHTSTNFPVAIKQFNKKDIKTLDSMENVYREIKILQMLDHPLISEYYDSFENEDSIFLMMEFVEEGTLLDLVNSSVNGLQEARARFFFCQIIDVFVYLHNEKHVIHRDLKAENILLDRNHNIRIIDFGLSNILHENQTCYTTVCGSPAYVAPEILTDQPYTQSADIWSIGILLFAMVASYLPFEDKNIANLINKVLHEEPVYPKTFSQPLVDLLKKLLTKNPKNRINLAQIKEHQWFIRDPLGNEIKYNFSYLHKFQIFQKNVNGDVIIHLDDDVLEQLESFAIDTENLLEELMYFEKENSNNNDDKKSDNLDNLDDFECTNRIGKRSPVVAAYRGLFREKVTDDLYDLEDKLSEISFNSNPMSQSACTINELNNMNNSNANKRNTFKSLNINSIKGNLNFNNSNNIISKNRSHNRSFQQISYFNHISQIPSKNHTQLNSLVNINNNNEINSNNDNVNNNSSNNNNNIDNNENNNNNNELHNNFNNNYNDIFNNNYNNNSNNIDIVNNAENDSEIVDMNNPNRTRQIRAVKSNFNGSRLKPLRSSGSQMIPLILPNINPSMRQIQFRSAKIQNVLVRK